MSKNLPIKYIIGVLIKTPIIVYSEPLKSPKIVPPASTITGTGKKNIGRITNVATYITAAHAPCPRTQALISSRLMFLTTKKLATAIAIITAIFI